MLSGTRNFLLTYYFYSRSNALKGEQILLKQQKNLLS